MAKKRLFETIFEILSASGVNSASFWDPKRIPRNHFLVFFEGKSVTWILDYFLDVFFEKKYKKKKTEKVAFVS